MLAEILFIVLIGATVVGVCGLSMSIVRALLAYREWDTLVPTAFSSVDRADASRHLEAVLDNREQNEHLARAD